MKLIVNALDRTKQIKMPLSCLVIKKTINFKYKIQYQMPNPNWQKGIVSPNPEGRRKTKYSSRTTKGLIENFIKRNITPRKLQQMYDKLSEQNKLNMLIELLPYCASKQPTMTFERLSDTDLDNLYERVMKGLEKPIIPLIQHNNNGNGQKAED